MIELVVNASLLVQMVMAVLVMASLVSWVMIFQRSSVYSATQNAIEEFEDYFWSGIDLRDLYSELEADRDQLNDIESIFVNGFKEYLRLSDQTGMEADAALQGAQRAMKVALVRAEENLDKHLPFLATVGSTSPYIGLFGTVWGIMNSFRSLANMTQATLSAVAPGISEALIATAMGLFAAIPAVIAYNRYAARSETLMNRYDTFAEELSSILYRAAHAKSL
ncbi:MAG: protein TolQ [Pseudomonadales bacterium]|nr:protein TolQ [Pseudomonadales bacterium]